MMDDDFCKEKRRFIRYKLKAQGSLTFLDGAYFHGTIRDISVGGTFLEVTDVDPIRVGQQATAAIIVELNNDTRSLEAICQIARITDEGIGLFFKEMDETCKLDFVDIIREIRNHSED